MSSKDFTWGFVGLRPPAALKHPAVPGSPTYPTGYESVVDESSASDSPTVGV